MGAGVNLPITRSAIRCERGASTLDECKLLSVTINTSLFFPPILNRATDKLNPLADYISRLFKID